LKVEGKLKVMAQAGLENGNEKKEGKIKEVHQAPITQQIHPSRIVKNGRHRDGRNRYKCKLCG